ncbi:solute carrier family 38 member 8-like isoform X2 [Lycorma delicatula]
MALCLLALWGLITANVVAAEHQVVSMQELLESTCGRYFAVSAATIIFIYSVLCCTVYLVVIGDQFERVFLTLSGPTFCEKWYLNRDLAIICSSLIIILPNLFSKKMDFLKYVSRLGVLAIFYVGAMVTTEYFISNYKPNNEKNSVGKPDSSVHLYEVILSFATICYAYHCHVQSIAILGCLKDRSPKKIIIAVVAAFSIVSLLYASTGTFGYLTFGNDVKSNIILNYDPREPIVLLAFVLLALKICSSYPIVLFCGRYSIKK